MKLTLMLVVQLSCTQQSRVPVTIQYTCIQKTHTQSSVNGVRQWGPSSFNFEMRSVQYVVHFKIQALSYQYMCRLTIKAGTAMYKHSKCLHIPSPSCDYILRYLQSFYLDMVEPRLIVPFVFSFVFPVEK